MPPTAEFIPALGPALVLAAIGARRSTAGADRRLKVQLRTWILLVLVLILAQPVGFTLYVIGRTPCRAYLSHPIAPGFEERRTAVQHFYTAASPAERANLLDRLGVDYVVLPGDPGLVPEAWLGPASSFRQLAHLGRPPAIVSIYGRVPRGAGTHRT